ncbi:MAG: KH domain-containing protein, partial [Desulfosarcina sp.]|nr:KH domain-containing protein [Desulfobacterales bacterium]
PDIDPVGACVGMKGSRVQNVVQELKGEKIDIITWYADIAKYVCNALAPAEIIRVIIDEQNHSMEVIVPDESLSIAIGKGGQNVRLASKLTSWRLDVQNDTKYSKTLKDGYESLIKLPGIGISLADALYENGFFSPLELSSASVQELLQIREMTEAKAAELIEAANESLKNLGTDETSDKDETSDTDGTDETSDKDETSGTDGTDETSDKDKTSGTNGTDDTSDKDETSDTNGTDDTSDKDETSGTDGTDDTSDKDETSGTDDTSDKDDQDIESNPLMKDTE